MESTQNYIYPKGDASTEEILQSIQDDKHPKLTIGMFFEFMRTAYQVYDSVEGLATVLSTSSEIDWNKLARLNLNLEVQHENKTDNEDKFDIVNTDSRNKDEEDGNKICELRENKQVDEETINIRHVCNSSAVLSDINNHNETVYSRVPTSSQQKIKTYSDNPSYMEDTNLNKSRHGEESVFTKALKKNLSDILHEGLLDSVLPYMIPKSVLSQPSIKKVTTNVDIKKSTSLGDNTENKGTAGLVTHKEKEKDKSKSTKKTIETEVEIHVCDEDKNVKKNFRCPQKLLIQKMRYFADVTAGQKLEEIDISVHCDVVIFDWLMKWVKRDLIKKSEWPVLEASNVIPIMVSASFLQMEPLLDSCIQYCHDNMSNILKTSTILTCLDDSLLTRLAELFTNEDVELLKDKKDKIQSRLFCKLIVSLAEVTPDTKKGHYSSLATLFKCAKCGKNIIQMISEHVPCIASAMKIDNNGNVYSKHIRDLTWNLNDYISTLRLELRSWRKVYWRLWGDCHFLYCQECNIYFPVHQMDWCYYHSEYPQFFVNEQQRSTPFPLGRYPCCSQRAYRFEVLSNQDGCKYKEHFPNIKSEIDIGILNIFTVHREVIAVEPPQLFFPEKITRLVARDPSLQAGKLFCKDIMWWSGLELMPPRPKLGLLGKLWSSTGFRKFTQMYDTQKSIQKLCAQNSVATDVSSPASSLTDSDEEDKVTGGEESSLDEESYYSEESNAWITRRSASATKGKLRNKMYQRCWNPNLNVRHNQDNQRDFEERAATQMIALLTKRMSADHSLLAKPHSKHGWRNNKTIGGTYVKLEAAFREQLAQSSKHKSSLNGKSSMRVKTNK
ncbi:hypothetical protein KM043_016201 [Ampulex compressa]|nr:hypothetical protein KM043_016201 [Ampulex compressa]